MNVKRAVSGSTRKGIQSAVSANTSGRGKKKTESVSRKVTGNIEYVLPLGNGWVVKSSAAKTFAAITDSKSEAIDIGRTLAQTKNSQLIVHRKNGTVEVRESYVR